MDQHHPATKVNGCPVKAESHDEAYFDAVFGIKTGFPRYALIDRKGRLVTDSAPHPNDEKIVEFILLHLDDLPRNIP